MVNNKTKFIKGMKITKGNTVYEKITHLSIYGNEVYFSHKENDSVSVNIECTMDDIEIQLGTDK